jgi:hypothetical protein
MALESQFGVVVRGGGVIYVLLHVDKREDWPDVLAAKVLQQQRMEILEITRWLPACITDTDLLFGRDLDSR